MKMNELKKRVSNAVRALKGAPMIERLAVPLLEVERQPITTLRVKCEISLDELGRAGPGYEAYCILPEMRANLLRKMEASGLVKHKAERMGDRMVYLATIRVVEPYEEG